MTVYKARSAWTSSGRGGAQLTGSKLVGIAWHWPGTSQDEIGVESVSRTANRLRGYRNFHVGTRGWSDIGYNFAIDQGGRVWDLRGLGRVGAHAASASNPDANYEWMGVLLILGDREEPSAAMIEACQDFRADVFLPRWPRRTRDTGHGRAPGVPGAQTSCPGPFVAELIVDGVLTDQPTEGSMDLNDNLDSDGTRRTMSPMARKLIPDSWGTYPAQLLGYAAAALAWMRNGDALSRKVWRWRGLDYVNDNPSTKDHQLARAHEYSFEALKLARRNAEKLDTLIDLQGGEDGQAIREHIDARADAIEAQITADAQRREEIAEQGQTERGAILDLVDAVASGEREAAEVVDEIARRLRGDEPGTDA